MILNQVFHSCFCWSRESKAPSNLACGFSWESESISFLGKSNGPRAIGRTEGARLPVNAGLTSHSASASGGAALSVFPARASKAASNLAWSFPTVSESASSFARAVCYAR